MSNVKFASAGHIRALSHEAWLAAVAPFRDHNYRQTWHFGLACAQRIGATSEHVAIVANDRTIGLADVRCKRLPFIGGGVAYINGGPLSCQAKGDACGILRQCLVALQAEYCDRRGMVLRIAPALGSAAWNEQRAAVFSELNFVASTAGRPYRTIVVDLNRRLVDIRSGLAQKWRNCLNRSERNDLEIRSGTGDELFSVFVTLYDELVSRKHFCADLDASFYRKVQILVPSVERFHVAIAYHAGVPSAGIIASLVGNTAVYLLGATNEVGMQQKAAYLLQWHVIETALERGCTYYDLGGIDPEGNPGVYHFKEGMGGSEESAPGPFEVAPDAWRARLVEFAERTYRWWRRGRSPHPSPEPHEISGTAGPPPAT